MKTRWIGIASLSLIATGCAGARSSIEMPTSKYPVSMSAGMYGPNHEMLRHDQMEKVGDLSIDRTAWGMFYSLLPLTPTLDISQEVNEQLAASHADAVIKLRSNVRPCALDYFFVFTFIPFWPGCANIEIRGDMIRLKRQDAPVQSQAQPQATR